jgi:hypothetical protein
MVTPAIAWRRFRARALRTAYGREDACLDLPPAPLSIRIGPKKPKRLLYVTKESFVHFTSFPDDVAVFNQSRFPSPATCELLVQLSRWARKPIWFVGDLDPLDLTKFWSIRNLVPIRYLGIDDRWLQLCRKHLQIQPGLNAITIKMGDTEREHFEVVKQLLPSLDRLIGPGCLDLLESGRKLELEGAGSPGLYKPGFTRALARLLLR